MHIFSLKFTSRVGAVLKHFVRNSSTDTMSNPLVTIQQGRLSGVVKKLYDGSSYYSFKGIPYAKPPIGKLRFMAPLPPEPWQGTYEANEHRSISPQTDMNTSQFMTGSEDCLFLNVYTKSLKGATKMPVMVYFHGGAFMTGSGDTDMYGPDFLIQHDIVLVTINYRLEALGFLCLDIPEVPGNAGMKDQVAALQWVQKNIEHFGGDPNNVTIFGESAGGASVTYHMLSPMSKGLFHKAIAQSGVCTIDWAQGTDGKERAIRVAKQMGCESTESKELLEFFQKAPLEKVVKLTIKSMTHDEKHRGLPIHFAPVVEKRFENVQGFLTEDPLQALLAGKVNKVPIICGYNSAEGLMVAKYQLKKYDFLNKYPSFYVPREIAKKVSVDALTEFGLRVKKFYVGERDFDEKDFYHLTNLLSDLHFFYGCHRFLNFYAVLNAPIFMYRFDCETDLNKFKELLGFKEKKGVSHVDELFYMFNNAMNKDCYEENENLRVLMNRITKLWTDFAKTSNPTPKGSSETQWLPYTTGRREYMSLNEKFTMGTFTEKERVEFWNKIYKDAGLPAITLSKI